ncbi:MAG TPA: DUF2637 domain-containing protein [Streptosporangiaceae bacterium]|jgi:hypothetical protein
MSANDLIASGDRSAERKSAGSALRRPTAWLAAVGVVVLLAAAFALSYDGFAALARAGGVSDRLARYYPVVYDAVTVVAFAAIFVLRTARVYVRLLTWLSAILVLGVCAGAAAVHAAAIQVPQKPLAAVVATMPFLMLVLAFRLWLTMLRHIRRLAAQRRQAVTYADRDPEPALEPGPVRPRRPETRVAPPLALPAAPRSPEPEPTAAERAATEAVAAEPRSAERVAERAAKPRSGEPGSAERGAEPRSAEAPAARATRTAPASPAEPAEPARTEPAPADEAASPEPALSDEAPSATAPSAEEPVARTPDPEAEERDEEEPFEPEPVMDADRPPLPVRDRARPRRYPGTPAELADTGPLPPVTAATIGDEDELVADEGPPSDPVSDEAEADEMTTAQDDDIDEFAELEADDEESKPEVPPPPSGRVRSSPLPPLDWGPGLGGLTGRRRTPRPRDDSENHAP